MTGRAVSSGPSPTKGLNATEVNKLCHRVAAEENQTECFTETVVSEEQKRAVKTFGEAFGQVSRTLDRLQRMEDKQPGLLAEALATESNLVESQVEAAIRGLSRVKSVLQDVRMGQLAKAG